MSRRRSFACFTLPRALFGFAFAFAFGCSSSTSSPGPTGDSGAGSGDTATGDTLVDTGRPYGEAATDAVSGVCWKIAPADPTLAKCQTCSEAKCKDKWDAAWGPAFISSGGTSTGGACGDTGKCVCGCSEFDAICKEACDVGQSAACKTARQAIYDCEGTSCTTECGRGGL